jgi:cbb3-type cytochrome oxidase maturation protein
MDVVFSLVPGMMVVGLILVIILIWAVKKGQYEDLDGDASRIILDDDDEDFVRHPADRKTPTEKK